MEVTLSPDLLELIREKVSHGEYPSESDVMSEGLRLLAARDHERKRGQLVAELDRGVAAAKAGDYEEFDEEGLKAFFSELQAEVSENRARRRSPSKA